jgi:hypothetical protein
MHMNFLFCSKIIFSTSQKCVSRCKELQWKCEKGKLVFWNATKHVTTHWQ